MTLVALSPLDHVYGSDAFDAIAFVFEFSGALDADRVAAAYFETAREFVGVGATLTAVAGHSLAFDLSREAAEWRIVDVDGDAPAASELEPLRTGLGSPLSRAYLIRRRNGRMAIAFMLAHVVADGFGYFLFLSSWAARTRGASPLVPNFDRPSVTPSPAEPVVTSEVPSGCLPQSGFILLPEDRREPRLPLVERRRDAIVHSGKRGEKGRTRLSANDVLCATLWKESVETDCLGDSTLTCLVDVRRHLPNGALYFGNASLVAHVTLDVATLRAAEVEEIGMQIRRAIDGVPARVLSAFQELHELRMRHGLDVLPRLRSIPPSGFAVTNMSRVPFGMIDFGTGGPVHVDVFTEGAQGLGCLVLPDGSGLRQLVSRREVSRA
jgi:hypothetical protein